MTKYQKTQVEIAVVFAPWMQGSGSWCMEETVMYDIITKPVWDDYRFSVFLMSWTLAEGLVL